ncbi:MAG: murein biosynthesis integral membrane protein MurJ [Acidimicrobiia bacterium]
MAADTPEHPRAASRPSWRAYLPRPETELRAAERPTGAATRMGAATLASRGVGFVRVWMITAVLGTTYLGNSFQATSSVSNVLFELLAAGALSAVLVPTFVELLDAGDQKEAERVASGLLGVAALGLGVVAVIGMILAPWLASVLSNGAPAGPIADRQQALSTFFLLFFIPQVVFYAFGTVATGVLYAQRRFVVPALAPVANTVIVVLVLAIFHVVHPGTSLDLTLGEKLLLAVGATLGVLGFCGVPVVAVLRSGFRLRATIRRPDARLRRMLHLSTWAVLQHMGIGILLAASIVMGNQVEGGVVAYQFAFVAFMAPYAILAQPVHTTILPSLSLDAAAGDRDSFAGRVRWAFESLTLLTLPVSAIMAALALPAMVVITVGRSSDADLLAAALASLAIGLLPYSAFLLFARAFYALGDSRTPAIVALITACAGAAVMVVGALAFKGSAVVAALGIGNTVAYVLGAAVLGVVLSRRLGHRLVARSVWKPLVLSIVMGLVLWGAERAIAPDGRLTTLIVLVVLVVLAGGAYLGVLRLLARPLAARAEPPAGLPELDPDLAEDL